MGGTKTDTSVNWLQLGSVRKKWDSKHSLPYESCLAANP